MTAIDALNAWSVSWSTLVVAIAWQSTLLAVLVAAIAGAWRRSSPSVRYWLWQIVAIKLLVMPLWSWSLPLPWPAAPMSIGDSPASVSFGAAKASALLEGETAAEFKSPESRHVSSELSAVGSRAWLIEGVTWRSWLFVGWSALVGLQIMRLAVQRRRLAGLLRQAVPAGAELIGVVRGVAERLQLSQPPKVLLTALDGSPFVCGSTRPTLVLPRDLLATLSSAELHQVLAHELAHVKRRDLVWGWIPEMARVLYFFHPVAHWVGYRIRLERELACDQWAMAASGRGPAEYADTLVRVLSAASRPSIFRTSAAAGWDGNTTHAPSGD